MKVMKLIAFRFAKEILEILSVEPSAKNLRNLITSITSFNP